MVYSSDNKKSLRWTTTDKLPWHKLVFTERLSKIISDEVRVYLKVLECDFAGGSATLAFAARPDCRGLLTRIFFLCQQQNNKL